LEASEDTTGKPSEPTTAAEKIPSDNDEHVPISTEGKTAASNPPSSLYLSDASPELSAENQRQLTTNQDERQGPVSSGDAARPLAGATVDSVSSSEAGNAQHSSPWNTPDSNLKPGRYYTLTPEAKEIADSFKPLRTRYFGTENILDCFLGESNYLVKKPGEFSLSVDEELHVDLDLPHAFSNASYSSRLARLDRLVRQGAEPYTCLITIQPYAYVGWRNSERFLNVLLQEHRCTDPENTVKVWTQELTSTAPDAVWGACGNPFIPPGLNIQTSKKQLGYATTTSTLVRVRIEVHNLAPTYVVRFMVSNITEPPADSLHLHYVTPHYGMLSGKRRSHRAWSFHKHRERELKLKGDRKNSL
jgi:hypothetical protein